QDGEKVIDITNVAYRTTGSYIPGRPTDEQLVLRTTLRSHQVVGDKGLESKVTVEAWPLGTALATKPLYAVTLEGVGAADQDNALLIFERGTEEVDWWSVYRLGNGTPLFDTYVPLLSFSITREIQTLRYVGLDVPPDDAADARLREPHIVGVLAYASGERVIRRALITCADAERARLLRSYWDAERTLSGLAPRRGAGNPTKPLSLPGRAAEPAARAIPAEIPIAHDDLDLARARLPAGLRFSAWQP